MVEDYLLQANDILLTQNKKDYYALISVTTDLAEFYSENKMYENAFEFQKKELVIEGYYCNLTNFLLICVKNGGN